MNRGRCQIRMSPFSSACMGSAMRRSVTQRKKGHHAPEEQGVEGRQRIPLFIVAVAAAPAQKQAEQKVLLFVHLVPYAVLFFQS